MDIEFYRIIFDVFIYQWDKKFASKYIRKEFYKAEKEKYDAEYFFESCIMVIDDLEKERINKFKYYKHYHQGFIEGIDSERNYSSTLPDIFYQKSNESREEYLLRLKNINEENFIDTVSYTNDKTKNNYKLNISKEDLMFLKNEINKTYQEINNQNVNNNEMIKSVPKFKLSKKTGAKIDLIRILNALYELKLIENSDKDDYPTKQEFMESFGDFLSVDFSKYDSHLSQAFNESSLESNLNIFEKMKTITSNSHYQNKNNK